ncbi:MAG: hypothetical protein JWR44_2960 [Hymenobacter sp.]|jgi:hypothetical protein|nr:hypothetical protein [Hymenobacter sp.]
MLNSNSSLLFVHSYVSGFALHKGWSDYNQRTISLVLSYRRILVAVVPLSTEKMPTPPCTVL